MKYMYVLSILVFLLSFSFFSFSYEGERGVFVGLKGGYSFLLVDKAGESFNLKTQYGGRFRFLGDVRIFDWIWFSIELPGFSVYDYSDDVGGYVYVPRLELPTSLGVSGVVSLGECEIIFTPRYLFSYWVDFSYYASRGFIHGIGVSGEVRFKVFEDVMVGIYLEGGRFFKEDMEFFGISSAGILVGILGL